MNIDWFWSKTNQSNWLLCAAEDKSIKLWCINNISQYTCVYQANSTLDMSSTDSNSPHFKNIYKNEIVSLQNYKFSEKRNLYSYFDAVWLDNSTKVLIAAITKCGTLKVN